MGAGTALRPQSLPLQHEQQISNIASLANELNKLTKLLYELAKRQLLKASFLELSRNHRCALTRKL